MRARYFVGVVIVILAVAFIGTYASIHATAESIHPQPGDVIIILGAAVWPDGPSPALKARIDHAAELFMVGYADNLILSGGLGEYSPTEAQAMKERLVQYGIPAERLYREEKATNTRENLRFSQAIMRRQGWEQAIIVSDPFHLHRALKIARSLGLEATGAPAYESPLYRNRLLRFRYTVREVVALFGEAIRGMSPGARGPVLSR